MSFLRPASWIRPLGHHLWKRKTFLLSIAIVILFVLLFAQFSDVNSPSRPLPLPFSFNRYISSKSRPQPASRVQNHDVYFGAAQSGAVLPKPFPVNNGHLPGVDSDSPIILPSGEPSDPETKKRRDFIRDMMLFAWNGYVKYAWGENELKPISKNPHLQGIFGRGKIGATITDSLDTLYIMGLYDEFNKGKEWIKNELSLNEFQGDLSVFETTIRVVGGLLTCYAFTKDRMFVDKAKEVADVLLPAFDSKTGIPFSLINPRTKVPKNYQWASASSYSILSEIGTMHLEFVYLSELVGDPVYKEKVFKVREILHNAVKPKGLYPNYINPRTGKWGHHHISMGALGDSYYEYLLKAWLQSGGEDTQAREMYDEAMAAVEKHLLRKSKGGLYYFADMKYERLEHKMGHLACFAGGLLSLGAQALEGEAKEHPMNIAAEITHTCHESYARTKTKLGPESFRFSDGVEAEATQSGEKYYILRPETIESYFYLWRFTKDKKYRDWAWEAAQALEKHCKVEAGYSGIHNVYDENSQKDDVQQSFLTAETFKYLYLIFSEDDLLPFERWVFNTEAHPLPIRGKNTNYFAPNSSLVKEESNKAVGDSDTVDEEEIKKE